MTKTKNKTTNSSLVLGVIGFIAGIALMFGEAWFIGIFGSIASAGLAYKGYQESKETQSGISKSRNKTK